MYFFLAQSVPEVSLWPPGGTIREALKGFQNDSIRVLFLKIFSKSPGVKAKIFDFGKKVTF